MKKFFIFVLILLPAVAHCQTTSWQSSHPELVSVDANGITKLETANTSGVQFVTIKSTTIHNGNTLTSSKQIEVNPYYPGCNSPSVYVNGIWWAGCNVGSSTAEGAGNKYYFGTNPCAGGWAVPAVSNFQNLDCSSGGSCNTAFNTNGGVWGSLNGVSGRWYSGNGKTATGLFLPANGCNCVYDPGVSGHYWANSRNGTLGYTLVFDSTASFPARSDYYDYEAKGVRCIKI